LGAGRDGQGTDRIGFVSFSTVGELTDLFEHAKNAGIPLEGAARLRNSRLSADRTPHSKLNSIFGEHGHTGVPVYASQKAGVDGMVSVGARPWTM
jgi:hypothetical protein